MAAWIIDGKGLAAIIQQEVAGEVARLRAQHGLVPCFASVLVGDHPVSRLYVRRKGQACQDVGVRYIERNLSEEASVEEVEVTIEELNAKPEVNGIIVQLPLPQHLHEETILSAVDPEKDVDGLHPFNMGLMAIKDSEPQFVPSTPKAVMALLDYAGVRLEGTRTVVVGRSYLVGLPLALFLIHRNATVTICHSRTPNLGEVTRQADILVVAVGHPRTIRGDMVKPGAVVIDVGINRIPDTKARSGYRLVGDVNFVEVVEVASAITPVPGGVGPMTVTSLLQNTVTAARRQWQRAGLLPEGSP